MTVRFVTVILNHGNVNKPKISNVNIYIYIYIYTVFIAFLERDREMFITIYVPKRS